MESRTVEVWKEQFCLRTSCGLGDKHQNHSEPSSQDRTPPDWLISTKPTWESNQETRFPCRLILQVKFVCFEGPSFRQRAMFAYELQGPPYSLRTPSGANNGMRPTLDVWSDEPEIEREASATLGWSDASVSSICTFWGLLVDGFQASQMFHAPPKPCDAERVSTSQVDRETLAQPECSADCKASVND